MSCPRVLMKIYLCISTCHYALYDFMSLNSQFHIVCEHEEWHFRNTKVGFYSLLLSLGSAKSECSDCTLQLVLYCHINYQAMFVIEFCGVVYGHSSLKFVIWWAVFKLKSNSVLALTKIDGEKYSGFQ